MGTGDEHCPKWNFESTQARNIGFIVLTLPPSGATQRIGKSHQSCGSSRQAIRGGGTERLRADVVEKIKNHALARKLPYRRREKENQ
jgi:hypothetical protein